MIDNIKSMSEGFKSVKFAQPLLSSDDDIDNVVNILIDKFSPISPDTAVVFMGHGTSHHTNSVYAALDYRFKDVGSQNFYMGTVEAYPTVDNVIKMLQKRREVKKVILAPFMIVAGDHAKNDMSGDDDDSWKSLFTKQGYKVECVVKGIGEYDEIANIFVQHAKAAEKESE
jgi:sirohydrochlorin cobaltochelatase